MDIRGINFIGDQERKFISFCVNLICKVDNVGDSFFRQRWQGMRLLWFVSEGRGQFRVSFVFGVGLFLWFWVCFMVFSYGFGFEVDVVSCFVCKSCFQNLGIGDIEILKVFLVFVYGGGGEGEGVQDLRRF